MQEIEIFLEKETNNEIEIKLESEGKEIFPSLKNLEVTPTKEQQVFNHKDSYGYDEVTINPIPDEYIIPNGTLEVASNGDVDVTNYKMARVGVYTPPTLQDKSITITENGTQNITFDEGYDGLNSVEVISKVSGSKYAPRHISFYYYEGTELNEELANLDTSNITSFYQMFGTCQNLLSIDLSHFKTTQVTNMNSMFSSCYVLTKIDVSNFDTSNVTTMRYMFGYCYELTSLDLSNFDTSKVTNMNSMFNHCDKLQYLDIRNFDFTNVTNYSYMFDYIPTNCKIIVKDNTAKTWVKARRSALTNIKTVAEL